MHAPRVAIVDVAARQHEPDDRQFLIGRELDLVLPLASVSTLGVWI
jgi:hypothetical protein